MIYKLLTTELVISATLCSLMFLSLIVAVTKTNYVAARRVFVTLLGLYLVASLVFTGSALYAVFHQWVS